MFFFKDICSVGVLRNKNKKGLLVLVILLLLIYFNGSSQSNTIDSLKITLTNATASNISKIYLSIAKEFRYTSYDSVIHYGNKAIENASLMGDKTMIIESLLELAFINNKIGNRDRSLLFYEQAKQFCLQEKDDYQLAKIYLALERYHRSMLDYASGICSLDTALNIINSNNFTDLRSTAFLNYGNIYLKIQYFSIATFYANQAIQSLGNKRSHPDYIRGKLLLGRIFFHRSNLDSALYYYKEALALSKIANNKIELQKTYRRISGYYIEIKDYDNSSMYIDSSIIYCNELMMPNELASLITFKAHITSLKGDYQNTLKYNLQALKLREKIGHRMSICASIMNIGGNYTQLGEYDQARYYLDRGIRIAKEQNDLHYLVYGYNKLAILNKKEGNYKTALKYTELKTLYNDSIITQRSNEKVLFLKNQFELEKAKSVSEKAKLEQKTNQTIFLIVTTILSLGIIILLSWLNYVKAKTSTVMRRAKEKAEEREFFFKESQNAANIGSYKLDLTTGVWTSSEVLNRIFDIDENYEKTIDGWTNLIHEEDREMMSKYLEDIISKQLQFNKEYRITCKSNGETRWVLGLGMLRLNNDGSVHSMAGTNQDITERKMVEAELFEYRENLEKIVTERTSDLNMKNRELEKFISHIVGRELRIKELKDKVKELEKRL